eukprot:334852_1
MISQNERKSGYLEQKEPNVDEKAMGNSAVEHVSNEDVVIEIPSPPLEDKKEADGKPALPGHDELMSGGGGRVLSVKSPGIASTRGSMSHASRVRVFDENIEANALAVNSSGNVSSVRVSVSRASRFRESDEEIKENDPEAIQPKSVYNESTIKVVSEIRGAESENAPNKKK